MTTRNAASNLIVRVRGLGLCCIPKNANTSMKLAILRAQDVPLNGKGIFRHPALNLGSNVAGLFTAAFVRHPVSRLVSAWQSKIVRDAGQSTRNLERHGFRVGMTFLDFAQLAVTRSRLDFHIQPQVDFLPERLDFLGRVETLDVDWPCLQSRFPWLPDLDWENVTVKGDWQPHCDPQTRDVIESHYADDLALFESASSLGVTTERMH